MASNIELMAYLGVLILCIIAFSRLTKAYNFSRKNLPSEEIISLAKTIMLTFAFIIVKIIMDYIILSDFIGEELYNSISLLATLIILCGIIYSVKLIVDFSKKFEKTN